MGKQTDRRLQSQSTAQARRRREKQKIARESVAIR